MAAVGHAGIAPPTVRSTTASSRASLETMLLGGRVESVTTGKVQQAPTNR